jgi:hypothetical protein
MVKVNTYVVVNDDVAVKSQNANVSDDMAADVA